MREDWNQRAKEDASYYVAFGRREQDDEEFFASGDEIRLGFEAELKRMPAGANRRAWRALEIGCGPGRLLRPMSRHFGEIHGVDVSDEMIALARRNLAGVPHAHVHAASGSDLAQFADESFDFVYSYAVFQHIPSGEVVFNYLREARRVLKPGGLMRVQLNGLPETAHRYDTWSGVRISPGELLAFLRYQDFQVLALEGPNTQYMWTTAIKRPAGWRDVAAAVGGARIRRVTNARSSEPAAPPAGRFASLALWVEGLPELADLFNLEIRVGGLTGRILFIGPRDREGMAQVNAQLPEGLPTGLQPVELSYMGTAMGKAANIRILPEPPAVPRLISLTDGINLLSGTRIVTGSIKVAIEEMTDPAQFRAWIDGKPAEGVDAFCADPLPPRYEVNFLVPKSVGPGPRLVEMAVGRRRLGPVMVEVV